MICGLNRLRAAASHPLLKYHTLLSPGEACAPSREHGRGGWRIYRGRRGSRGPTTCGGVIKSSDVRWAEVLFLPASAVFEAVKSGVRAPASKAPSAILVSSRGLVSNWELKVTASFSEVSHQLQQCKIRNLQSTFVPPLLLSFSIQAGYLYHISLNIAVFCKYRKCWSCVWCDWSSGARSGSTGSSLVWVQRRVSRGVGRLINPSRCACVCLGWCVHACHYHIARMLEVWQIVREGLRSTESQARCTGKHAWRLTRCAHMQGAVPLVLGASLVVEMGAASGTGIIAAVGY